MSPVPGFQSVSTYGPTNYRQCSVCGCLIPDNPYAWDQHVDFHRDLGNSCRTCGTRVSTDGNHMYLHENHHFGQGEASRVAWNMHKMVATMRKALVALIVDRRNIDLSELTELARPMEYE